MARRATDGASCVTFCASPRVDRGEAERIKKKNAKSKAPRSAAPRLLQRQAGKLLVACRTKAGKREKIKKAKSKAARRHRGGASLAFRLCTSGCAFFLPLLPPRRRSVSLPQRTRDAFFGVRNKVLFLTSYYLQYLLIGENSEMKPGATKGTSGDDFLAAVQI